MSAPVERKLLTSSAGEDSEEMRRRGGGYSQCEWSSGEVSCVELVDGDGERCADGWEDRKRENMLCIWVASSLHYGAEHEFIARDNARLPRGTDHQNSDFVLP